MRTLGQIYYRSADDRAELALTIDRPLFNDALMFAESLPQDVTELTLNHQGRMASALALFASVGALDRIRDRFDRYDFLLQTLKSARAADDKGNMTQTYPEIDALNLIDAQQSLRIAETALEYNQIWPEHRPDLERRAVAIRARIRQLTNEEGADTNPSERPEA